MPNVRLAGRYAKSLLDLAIEQNQLDVVHADMKYFQAVCAQSHDFVNVLRSPIIKADQKNAIVLAVIKDAVSKLTLSFVVLLVKKNRESALPEIATAFIEQYNTLKGIHQVSLTTAVAISDALKQSIEDKIKAETQFKIVELTTHINEDLIGGFVLSFDNNLIDASIKRDLIDIKKQFLLNEFISK